MGPFTGPAAAPTPPASEPAPVRGVRVFRPDFVQAADPDRPIRVDVAGVAYTDLTADEARRIAAQLIGEAGGAAVNTCEADSAAARRLAAQLDRLHAGLFERDVKQGAGPSLIPADEWPVTAALNKIDQLRIECGAANVGWAVLAEGLRQRGIDPSDGTVTAALTAIDSLFAVKTPVEVIDQTVTAALTAIDSLRYEPRLLGAARIGHSATDEPALGPQLREQLTAARNDAVSLVSVGRPLQHGKLREQLTAARNDAARYKTNFSTILLICDHITAVSVTLADAAADQPNPSPKLTSAITQFREVLAWPPERYTGADTADLREAVTVELRHMLALATSERDLFYQPIKRLADWIAENMPGEIRSDVDDPSPAGTAIRVMAGWLRLVAAARQAADASEEIVQSWAEADEPGRYGMLSAIHAAADALRQIIDPYELRRATAAAEAAPPAVDPARYDPNPTVNASDPDAYIRYAADLDTWSPGWYRDDVARMTPPLANEALRRRCEEGFDHAIIHDPDSQPSPGLVASMRRIAAEFRGVEYDAADRPTEQLAVRRAAYAAGLVPVPSTTITPRSYRGCTPPAPAAPRLQLAGVDDLTDVASSMDAAGDVTPEQPNVRPPLVEMRESTGVPILLVHPNGEVTIPPGMSASEAAHEFWQAVASFGGDVIRHVPARGDVDE